MKWDGKGQAECVLPAALSPPGQREQTEDRGLLRGYIS